MNPSAWLDPAGWSSLSLSDASVLLLWLVAAATRTFAAFIMLPMLSNALVTAPVRLTLALAVTLPVVVGQIAALGQDGQAQPAALPTQFEAFPILLLMLREAAIGVVLGLGFGALVAGLQAVGEIIDHQTGLTFTQNVDAANGNTVSVTSKLMEHVLFAVLMQAGIFLILVDTLYLSYELWPINQTVPALQSFLPMALLRESARLFSFALLLAGPVVLVLFIVDVGAGMMNRAAPNFNVFMMTLAIKPIIGMAVLALTLPMIVERSVLSLLELGATMKLLVR
jgi:type III secretion protein T